MNCQTIRAKSSFFREGRSVAQVAALLGIQETTVKKRLSRARVSLKDTLVNRAGEAFTRTAPGAAFTTVVVGLMVVGAPTTAAAAGLGVAKPVGSALPLAKVLAMISGAVLGPLIGVSGIWFGVQKSLHVARDEQERADLRRFRWANIGLVVAVSVAWAVCPRVIDSPWSIIVPHVLFVVGMCVSYGLWLPKIVARRHAAEVTEDPTSALKHRRQRTFRWLGLLLGVTFGSIGVYLGLRAQGALP